ncbi:hypothetical protein B0H16DRAFT_1851222 [Mycena metata]|uniref:DUF6533 domain-containing protein n=1 Tax=Mycena metata TaxID=1033252 RepID=A0AAD7IQ59_9AGAR|nr:hypothetical protein B0H16DRAFT_1851222 [Mycena metata]
MSAEGAIFATRYVSAVGVTTLLYDHVLTSGDEFSLIWLNPAAGVKYRAIFVFNRYVTEAVSLYAAYMLSGGSFNVTTELSKISLGTRGGYLPFYFFIKLSVTTPFRVFLFTDSVLKVILAMRVYTLWDYRDKIKWFLLGTFGAAFTISLAFSIVTVLQVQSSSAFYDLVIRMCGITQKPWALSVVLGVWVLFDFLVIILAVANALEIPHHTDAEVMASLQQDGARMFLCLLALRLGNFIVLLVADPAYCFVTFTVLWAMCSIVSSRLQLRVERLRFTRSRFGGLSTHFISF